MNHRAEGTVLVIVSKHMHVFIQGTSCNLPLFFKVCSELLGKTGSFLLSDLVCAFRASRLLHPPKAGSGLDG